MWTHIRIPFLVLICLLSLSCLSFAATNEESLTITTYYPSPYGVYKTLRLFPNQIPAAINCSNIGELSYYQNPNDLSKNGLYVCGEDQQWQQFFFTGGGAAGGLWSLVDPSNPGNKAIYNTRLGPVGIGTRGPLRGFLDIGSSNGINIRSPEAFLEISGYTGPVGEGGFEITLHDPSSGWGRNPFSFEYKKGVKGYDIVDFTLISDDRLDIFAQGGGVRIAQEASLYLGNSPSSVLTVSNIGSDASLVVEDERQLIGGFYINDPTPFIIDADGNVGIGTATPQAKLDVEGGVKIGNDPSACVSGKKGTIRYNSGAMEYCDGSSWISVGWQPGMHCGVYSASAMLGTVTVLCQGHNPLASCPADFSRAGAGAGTDLFYTCVKN